MGYAGISHCQVRRRTTDQILYLVRLVRRISLAKIKVRGLLSCHHLARDRDGNKTTEGHGSFLIRFTTLPVKWIYIAISVYLLLGVLGYWSNSGITGIELLGGQKASRLRRICVVLFWPLAMIGAIEA